MNADSIFLLSNTEANLSTSPKLTFNEIIEPHSDEVFPKKESLNKRSSSLSTDSSESSNSSKEGNFLSVNTHSLKRHPSCLHLYEENQSETVHKFNNINITPVSFDNETRQTKNLFTAHDMRNGCDYFYIEKKKSKQTSKKHTLGLTYKPKAFPKRNLMSPQEIEFDKEITKCIQNRNNFNLIENKFSHLLKQW